MLKKLLIIVGFTSIMSFARLMLFSAAVLFAWQGSSGSNQTSFAAPANAAAPKVVYLTEPSTETCDAALDNVAAQEEAGITVYRPQTTDERLAVAHHGACSKD